MLAVVPASIVTGPGSGGEPLVRAFNLQTLSDERFVYNPAFTGGVHVATGDLNHDGQPDLITGAGPGGGPHVRIFDGLTGEQLPAALGSFFAYDARFTGGVFVASGDINDDGWDDLITGAGPGGGPHVRMLSGASGAELYSFFAYDSHFTGGVSVAAGDIDGDGQADIITGAGPSGGPHVRVFSGATGMQLNSALGSFFAYNPAFPGGVFVAAGDINGDGRDDVITGAGPGGGPHVRVFSGATGEQLSSTIGSFYAYNPVWTGGVYVAAGDVNTDGRTDLITGAGPSGGPHIRVFSGIDHSELASFYAYSPDFTGGATVAWRGTSESEELQLFAALADDTGIDGDGITFDSTIRGSVSDRSRIASLQVTFGTLPGSLFVEISDLLQADGTFVLTPARQEAILGAPLPDGLHTLTLRAVDEQGNARDFAVSFTLDGSPPPLQFDLSVTSDSGTAGDRQTTAVRVELSGVTGPNIAVTLLESGDHHAFQQHRAFSLSRCDARTGQQYVYCPRG